MLEFLHHRFEMSGPLLGPLAQMPWWLYACLLVAIIAATTVHEAAHAWMADCLGDPGPREQGRVSLNPLRHIDPLGFTIMAVTMLIGFPIGWGKSLKTDPTKYRCGARKGAALVAMAGPLGNMALAVLLSLFVRLFLGGIIPPVEIVVALALCALVTVLVNVSQFCFNLIPIHPMDGAHVVLWALPEKIGDAYQAFMQRWGVYLFLVMVFTEIPGQILLPLMRWIMQLLIGIPF